MTTTNTQPNETPELFIAGISDDYGGLLRVYISDYGSKQRLHIRAWRTGKDKIYPTKIGITLDRHQLATVRDALNEALMLEGWGR